MLNPFLLTKLRKLGWGIGTTTISFQPLDGVSNFLFNQQFKFLETTENFTFIFEQVNPKIPSKFIYEGLEIAITP